MMELKDEGNESGKLGKPRKPRRGARGGAEGPQGSVRDPKPRKVEELGQRKQEREGELVGGKEGKGRGWRVVRFGIGSGIEGARHLKLWKVKTFEMKAARKGKWVESERKKRKGQLGKVKRGK